MSYAIGFYEVTMWLLGSSFGYAVLFGAATVGYCFLDWMLNLVGI